MKKDRSSGSLKAPSPAEMRGLLEALDVRDYLRDLHVLCKSHRAKLEEVLAGVRTKHVSAARHACVLRMRDDGLSCTSIGELLNMDHSAVLYVWKRAAEKRA